MTMTYALYSPAPPTTRLHGLNETFGKLLAEGGIANRVVPVPLPDSINAIAGLDSAERAMHLPIITPIDLLPAIAQTGPDWHSYDRANDDLRFVASLYDVAFGVMAFGADISRPDDLRGKRIAVPPRPSSVRLYSEALLFAGWGLEGEVELVDMMPPDLLGAVEAGEIDATTWNITTVEGAKTVAALPWAAGRFGAHWIGIVPETVERINATYPFIVSPMLLGETALLSFRQGLAVWRETPQEVVEKIVAILVRSENSGLYHKKSDIDFWPGIVEAVRYRCD